LAHRKFSGAGQTILGLDGKPIPANIIQPSMINPVSAKLISFIFPAPTTNATNLPGAPNLVENSVALTITEKGVER
jgi:hypothetical protein